MSRRAVGAALCAAAAIALVVAGFGPWWRIQERGDAAVSLRANFTLLGGEVCRTDGDIECKALSYTGRPGLRDELFAWTGRAELLALLVAAGLAIGLAFAGGRRRAPLRVAIAVSAGSAAAIGAAVVALERLPLSGDTQLAIGLWAALGGAMLAAAAAAWPIGDPGPVAPGRRWGLAGGIVAVALLAWATVGLRAWWTATGTFASHGMSPLGIELCDRDQCTQFGLGARKLAPLAAMSATAATAAVMLVCAAGLAVRAARGVAPRGWSIATIVSGGLALVLGAVTLVVVPRRGAAIDVGAWAFHAGTVATIVLAVMSHRLLRWLDPADAGDGAGPRVVPLSQVPRGPRPVLPALGPAGPAAPRAPAVDGVSPYAPRPAPPPASPGGDTPRLDRAAAPSPFAPPTAFGLPIVAPAPARPLSSPFAPPTAMGLPVVVAPPALAAPALAAPEAASPFAPLRGSAPVWPPVPPAPTAPAVSPFAPPSTAPPAPVAVSPYAPPTLVSSPAVAASPYAPPTVATPPAPAPAISPYAPGGAARAPAPSSYAPPAPSPYAPPYAAPSPYPPRAAAPANPIPQRVAPFCPHCRTAMLWHGKRAAWWCSTCKRTL